MDTHTKLLLQEARHIFHRLLKEEVVDFVSTTDFQSYWQHANEDIQSSKSGCHFGHYKAANFDHYLSAMHTAKLTLAASTGVPLARWGNELTILLKKVFGNIYIDKMRAICLPEDDYNKLNKFVFAKQMIDHPSGIVCKKGITCNRGSTNIRTCLQYCSSTAQNCGNRMCGPGQLL
jgi:hypothetical protein